MYKIDIERSQRNIRQCSHIGLIANIALVLSNQHKIHDVRF